MASIAPLGRTEATRSRLTDDTVVERVLAGEVGLFEILMRRYNERVYRVARSVLRDDTEAEDVMQETYVRAFRFLDRYERRGAFANWVLKIAFHEALSRLKHRRRFVQWDEEGGAAASFADELGAVNRPTSHSVDAATFAAEAPETPEAHVGNLEIRELLSRALDHLPQAHRTVFVLRDVEGLTTREVSDCLSVTEDNVKVMLHRARAALRARIDRQLGREVRRLHSFHLLRCDHVVEGVFHRLDELLRTETSGFDRQDCEH